MRLVLKFIGINVNFVKYVIVFVECFEYNFGLKYEDKKKS